VSPPSSLKYDCRTLCSDTWHRVLTFVAGWGSIEYATSAFTGGQVLGGRWKPLHYWYRASIFAEVMASCGVGGECYVRNDRPGLPFTGTLSVASVSFASGQTTYLLQASVRQTESTGCFHGSNCMLGSHAFLPMHPACPAWTRTVQDSPLSLPPGPGAAEFFSIGGGIDGTKNILVATITASDGTVVSKNVLPLVVPGSMVLPQANVTFSVSQSPNPDGSVAISVTTDAVAVYVTFTTLAQVCCCAWINPCSGF
jgi:beta-mannosidase